MNTSAFGPSWHYLIFDQTCPSPFYKLVGSVYPIHNFEIAKGKERECIAHKCNFHPSIIKSCPPISLWVIHLKWLILDRFGVFKVYAGSSRSIPVSNWLKIVKFGMQSICGLLCGMKGGPLVYNNTLSSANLWTVNNVGQCGQFWVTLYILK